MSFLSKLADRILASKQPTRVAGPTTGDDTGHPFRLELQPDVTAIDSMSAPELECCENADVPTIARTSDLVEAAADERQETRTSLNFPLHWTSAQESWTYLFDFAVACELLAPRPDELVLDFAAGTCWATELLNRMGVRTVSVDLSHEMMRRGRQRLLSDSRLVFADSATFVAGRGQQLPLRADVFDGVLCMNALHHLPGFKQGLLEIFRVLKPGGRAVFSEPGWGHSNSPHSAYRMREESVIEKGVNIALVRRLARDVGFADVNVVPLRSPRDYILPYRSDSDNVEPLRAMWLDTLKHSAKEHARFMLQKGGTTPDDTLLPPARLQGRLSASIELVETIPIAQAGSAFVDRLKITNTGTVIWRAQGRRFGGQVTIGLKFCDLSGQVMREDLGRTPLPKDLKPQETTAITLRVLANMPPGNYELRYDMVVEGVTWFEFHGSPCARRRIVIT